MKAGDGLIRQGAWDMEQWRKKMMKENRAEWMDQVEAGTDLSFKWGERIVPWLFWNTKLCPTLLVEFIHFHKRSVIHHIELLNSHSSKQILWVLCFEHIHFSTIWRTLRKWAPKVSNWAIKIICSNFSDFKMGIISTLTYFRV